MVSLNIRSFLAFTVTLACICAFRLSFTPKFQGRLPAKLGNGWKRSKSLSVNSAVTAELGAKPTPGSPIIRYVYSNSNLALLSIAVSGQTTQKAFNQACELFNQVRLLRPGNFSLLLVLPPNTHQIVFRIQRTGKYLVFPWAPSSRTRFCTISTQRRRSRTRANTSSTTPSRCEIRLTSMCYFLNQHVMCANVLRDLT